MARFKLLLAFLAFMICAGGIVVAYFYWKKFAEPEMFVNRQIAGEGEVREKPDLGKRHFDKAIDLVKEGEIVSARDRLLYLMTYFPESKTHSEARRIVGELNMDLLVSKIPQPNKSIHIVRSGEALVSIAGRSQTTIDYIMRASGKVNTLIYPNEELIVYPLALRAEVNLSDKLVTLFEGELFFKEYAIQDTNLPPEFSSTASTTVREKVAWHDGKPINFENTNYMDCTKWIRTGKIGLVFREYDSAIENGSQVWGIMLDTADMEELFTVLRNGSRVDLRK
ncbi:MAG: LysM peptidoglycan-binding domain-containing protein [Verrucomicrobiales bacterium]|nr:LysM peptidoglycan-binding domain-containing protein [Verrucomicrobiales bacterium]